MNAPADKFDSQKTVNLVGFYATPLALLLGVMGIVVSEYDNNLRMLCLGMLGFSAFFNLVFPRFLKAVTMEKKAGNVLLRMVINLTVNALLVYALGGTYRSMWLILALTPFATAIYGTRQKTAVSAAIASLVLVAVHVLQRDMSLVGWAEVLGRIAFIILISLMINGVASQVAHPEKGS